MHRFFVISGATAADAGPRFVRRHERRAPARYLSALVFCALLLGSASCQTTKSAEAPKKRKKDPMVVVVEDTAPSQTPSAEAYRAVIESDLLLEAGNTNAARARIDEAILADPNSAFLYTRLGEMRLAAGQLEGAADAANNALRLKDDSVPALLLLAKARALQADRDEAVRLLRKALAISPGDRDASTELAAIFLREDDVPAAEAVIEALMQREPNATDGYVTLAQLFAERGAIAAARKHLDAALERDARDLEALDLGRLLAEAAGDFKTALRFAKRTVRERGDSRSSRHLLLRALLLADEREEASTLVTAWLINDDSDDMVLLIADAMERAGQRSAAQALLADRRPAKSDGGRVAPRVLAERGRLAYADHAFGPASDMLCQAADGLDGDWRAFSKSLCLRALAFDGQRPLAIAQARGELERDPPSLRVLSAAASLAKLEPEGAPFRQTVLDTFSSEVKIESADDDVLESYVEALESLDSPRAARAMIDKALLLRPKSAARKMLLARHLERQGDAIAAVAVVESQFDLVAPTQEQLNFVAFTLADNALRPKDAVNYAWRALVRSPTSGYLLDTLGWAQFRAGDLDSAWTHLKRADQMSPKEAEILLHLSQVAAAKNDTVAARESGRAALDVVLPGDPILERIEAHLLTLDEEPS